DEHSDAEGGRSVSTVSVVAAVVPADQVRFATEGETKHDDAAMGTVTARAAMLDEDGNEIHEEGYHEDALVPASGDTVTTPPAPEEEEEENATQDGGDETRWFTWHRLWYNKGPVKVLGFLALLFTVFLILLSVILTQQKMDTDFAYIQLIQGPSNLNTVMDVFEFYRGDVFYAVDDDNAARLIDPGTPTRAPTRAPTFKPTVFGNPTPVPTFKPTISSKPTALPTIAPTSRPTLSPTGSQSVPVSVYTDFRVTGCWGLYATKESYDGAAQPNWDYYKFRAYMEDGFVADMTDACDYVETHRDYLGVHPDWNSTTDCLSEQYKKIRSNPAYPINMPVRDTLF
ncbi:MAG: hypothetical protein GY851_32150, partial [bacterium]|nr:hypothetical protein [bacterium]